MLVKPQPAYVEDFNEEKKQRVRGTRRSAIRKKDVPYAKSVRSETGSVDSGYYSSGYSKTGATNNRWKSPYLLSGLPTVISGPSPLRTPTQLRTDITHWHYGLPVPRSLASGPASQYALGILDTSSHLGRLAETFITSPVQRRASASDIMELMNAYKNDTDYNEKNKIPISGKRKSKEMEDIPTPMYTHDIHPAPAWSVLDGSLPLQRSAEVMREGSSRSSKEKKAQSDSGYSSHDFNTASDASTPLEKSAGVVRESSKEDRSSRRKSRRGNPTKTPRKSSKPPTSRNVNFSDLPTLDIPIRSRDDPSYFGLSSNTSTPANQPAPRITTMPNTSKSARPQSYYGGMPMPINYNRPPLARSAYYVALVSEMRSPTSYSSIYDNRPPLARSANYVAPVSEIPSPTSYPPVSPSASWMKNAAPGLQDPYFNPQVPRAMPLAERFRSQNPDPIQRTASAPGVKELTQSFYNQDSYGVENPNSISGRSKEMEDMYAIPPPPQPEPRPTRPTIQQMTTIDSLDMYERDTGNSRIQIETPNGRRRSYYDDRQIPQSATAEDRIRESIRETTSYQEEVAGGPTVNLTAEALRQSQYLSGSNHSAQSSPSTRSSGSDNESEWKRSVTTRTTTSRSGHDADDVTFCFKAGATVNIAGAEIKCDDGAEVNIIRRKSIRNGSEQSDSGYGSISDDHRRRNTRPANISRSTSESGFSDPYANPWKAFSRPPVRNIYHSPKPLSFDMETSKEAFQTTQRNLLPLANDIKVESDSKMVPVEIIGSHAFGPRSSGTTLEEGSKEQITGETAKLPDDNGTVENFPLIAPSLDEGHDIIPDADASFSSVNSTASEDPLIQCLDADKEHTPSQHEFVSTTSTAHASNKIRTPNDMCAENPGTRRFLLVQAIIYLLVVIGFYEEYLPQGQERVRWKCFCGKYMHDDFAGDSPEYVEGHRKELNTIYENCNSLVDTGVVSESSDISSGRLDDLDSAENDGGGDQQDQDISSVIQSDQGTPPRHESPAEDSTTEGTSDEDDAAHDTDSTTATSMSGDTLPLPRWILPCFQYKIKGSKVKHVAITNDSTDTNTFLEFRRLYFEQKSWLRRFFDIRAVKAIHLTNFYYLANEECDIADEQARFWPGGAQSVEWDYSPRPKTKRITPQVSQNRLMHIWQNPQHASIQDFAQQDAKRSWLIRKFIWLARRLHFKPRPHPDNTDLSRSPSPDSLSSSGNRTDDPESCPRKPSGRTYIIGRTPKKIGSRLEYNEFEEPPQGWGLWMEEGVRPQRFCMVAMVIFVLASVIFVVAWEVENKGAAHQRFESTTVASWLTGLITLVGATLVAYTGD